MKKVVKLALFAGIAVAIAKLVTAKKSDWEGLTESDVRAKLDGRLPERVPANTRAALADKVVEKMRDRGALVEEPTTPATD